MEATGVRSTNRLFLSGLAYVLGELEPIDRIEGIGAEKLASMKAVGLSGYARTDRDPFELASASARATLRSTSLDPKRIGALLYAIEPSVNSSNNWVQDQDNAGRLDIKWLLGDLGIEDASVVGLSMFNCASFISAIRLGRALMEAEGHAHVLVVIAGKAGDAHALPRLPSDNTVQSDGAASFVLSREPTLAGDVCEVLGTRLSLARMQAFRDPSGSTDYGKYVLEKARSMKETARSLFADLAMSAADFRVLVMQNISAPVIQFYRVTLGFEEEQTFGDNLGRVGHVIGVDNIVNLRDRIARNDLAHGDRILLLGTSGIAWGLVALERSITGGAA